MKSGGPLNWVEISTLGDLLVRAAMTWPDEDAVVLDDSRHTFQGLFAASETMAKALIAVGVRPEDRVGIYMPTCLDFVETMFACAMTGAVPVLVNARFRAREVSHVLRDSDAVTAITADIAASYGNYSGRLKESLEDVSLKITPIVLGAPVDGFIDRQMLLTAAGSVASEAVHSARQDVRVGQAAVMPYTSGTTGQPKGCLLTHESLMRVAIAAADRWGISDYDRIWDPLPLFHIGGIFPLLTCMHRGATFVTTTHFDPQEAIEQLVSERCTFAYPLFPTIMQALVHHPAFAKADFTRIRTVVHAAPPEAMMKVERHWPHAKLTSVYGFTECGGLVSLGAPTDPDEKRIRTSGRSIPGVSVRIVDPESGLTLPAGRKGEIVVKSTAMFGGYHNDSKKTSTTLRDGWFHTGDLGALDDDGWLSFLGRTKDMMKVGGENVAAAEIETYLEQHPSVKLAQVVGVPDRKYVEVPAAFVELLPGTQLHGDDLRAFCQDKIASFKVPRYFRIVSEWPTSSTKIQKFRLRQGLIDELRLDEI